MWKRYQARKLEEEKEHEKNSDEEDDRIFYLRPVSLKPRVKLHKTKDSS